MKLPTTKQAWVIKNKWVMEALSITPAILGSLVGGVKAKVELDMANSRLLASDGGSLDKSGIWWIIGGAVLSVVIGAWRAVVARAENARASQRESPTDLYACCMMLRSMLTHGEANDCLRITIHRVISRRKGGAEQLEQLTDYACPDGQRPGEAGRLMSAHCGIVGHVARTGEAIAAVRASVDPAEFRKEMIREWSFTDQQARELDDTRWSWMGVPLMDERGRVEGVIFFDSCESGYFHDAKKAMILRGCESLNRFARERYP